MPHKYYEKMFDIKHLRETAEKLKNSMKRNSNSSNSNSFSNPGGLNNMEGYSNTDRLNSF